MFQRIRIYAEITSAGVYTLWVRGKEARQKTFSDLNSFFENLPRNANVYLALSRDRILLQKVTLPSDAKDYIEEAVEYIAEDLFPGVHEYFTFKPYILKENDTLELFLIGINNELHEKLKEQKNIKLVTLSAFVIASEYREKNITVLNELDKSLYEKIFISRGRVENIKLIYKQEDEKLIKPSDFLRIFEKVTSRGKPVDFFFIKRDERKERLKIINHILMLLLVVIGFYETFSYFRIRKELSEVEDKIVEYSKYVEEYSRLRRELEQLKKEINIIKNYRSEVLKYLWILSKVLPEDTWIESFTYISLSGEIIIEGYTTSTTKLLRHISKTEIFRNVHVEGIPIKQGDRERFKLRIKLVKM